MYIRKSNPRRTKTKALKTRPKLLLPQVPQHAGRRRRAGGNLGVAIFFNKDWWKKARQSPPYAIGLRERVHLDGGEIDAKDLDPDDVKILTWLFEKRTGLACEMAERPYSRKIN